MDEILRIPMDDLETNPEDSYFNAVYQGRPFTGIACDEWNGEYSEIPYVNGTAHGRCFWLFSNGALASEEFVEHGEVVDSVSWWPPGDTVRHRQTPELNQYFYQDGTLCQEETPSYRKLFYPSGALKEEILYGDLDVALTYYGEDGQWAAKGRFSYIFRTSYSLEREGLTFNEPYIHAHAPDLLAEPAMDFQKYFTLWLPPRPSAKPRRFSRRKETPPPVRAVICGLIQSELLHVKYYGINLAGFYHVTEAVPLLEEALTLHAAPPSYHAITGGGHGYDHTIAQRAQWALDRLGRI